MNFEVSNDGRKWGGEPSGDLVEGSVEELTDARGRLTDLAQRIADNTFYGAFNGAAIGAVIGRLADREAVIVDVAKLLRVSGQRTEEIYAASSWTWDELRTSCMAGWTPENGWPNDGSTARRRLMGDLAGL